MTHAQQSIVFNFTHVYETYGFMRGEAFRWVDCTALEGTDCYCDTEAERLLKERMASLPLHALHWLDSGDYHYLSKLWTDSINVPFSLVVLDHHPDMQRPMFGELLSCGSWVREALEQNPYLKKVVLVGVDDKVHSEAQGFEDKVVFIGETEAQRLSAREMVKRMQLEGPLYLSIDKDVMSVNECSTNWDQGSMKWPQLTALLEQLANSQILGVDICGEEPKTLTDCVYCQDIDINGKFNESLYELIKEIYLNDG